MAAVYLQAQLRATLFESEVACPPQGRHSEHMLFSSQDGETIAKTVCDLVAIKSLSGDEARMADYVQSFLTKIGVDVARDDQDNVVAVIEPKHGGDPKRTSLHLSGHTDTVVPVEGWASDPWTPQLSGSGDQQRLIGLGSSDMKSGLAVMLYLCQAFERQRLERLRLVVSFTVCEEGPTAGKRNGVHRVLEKHPGRWALTTEASCDHICPTISLGCQGHAVARITLRGRSAHSARPERGINAIYAAASLCPRIEKLHASFKDIPILGEVQARGAVAVTQVKGGAASNIIPEQCELTLSRRLAPGETAATMEQELQKICAAAEGVECRWTIRNDAPACCVDLNGQLLKSASEASRRLFGQARYGWNRARTDMVLFAQAGMDVLNVGPGLSGQPHTAGEHLLVRDLPRAGNLLAQTLHSLDEYLVQ